MLYKYGKIGTSCNSIQHRTISCASLPANGDPSEWKCISAARVFPCSTSCHCNRVSVGCCGRCGYSSWLLLLTLTSGSFVPAELIPSHGSCTYVVDSLLMQLLVPMFVMVSLLWSVHDAGGGAGEVQQVWCCVWLEMFQFELTPTTWASEMFSTPTQEQKSVIFMTLFRFFTSVINLVLRIKPCQRVTSSVQRRLPVASRPHAAGFHLVRPGGQDWGMVQEDSCSCCRQWISSVAWAAAVRQVASDTLQQMFPLREAGADTHFIMCT